MRRLVHAAVPLVALLLAACTDAPQPAEPGAGRRADKLIDPPDSGKLGGPVAVLTGADKQMFARGRYLFQKVFTPARGLGPTFNGRSCAQCHGGEDGIFADSIPVRLETHFTLLNADGSCSQLLTLGGVVKQDSATNLLRPYFTTEPLPTGQHQVASRMTPDLFGFGLIEAIPDTAILALADPDDANGDGISGRAHMADGAVGRFGRKAADHNLDRFNAHALLFEMGITNPQDSVENLVGKDTIGGASIPASVDMMPESDSLEMDSGDLASLNAFIRFLGAAPSQPHDSAGEALFNSIGCAKCHTPEFTTVSSTPMLNGKQVRPFSDFLLHDMGPNLGDICLGTATNTEFRTEPLMGARFMKVFLHDGRANSINHAILQHGGEAQAARDAYAGLTSAQRTAVTAYIRTL